MEIYFYGINLPFWKWMNLYILICELIKINHDDTLDSLYLEMKVLVGKYLFEQCH